MHKDGSTIELPVIGYHCNECDGPVYGIELLLEGGGTGLHIHCINPNCVNGPKMITDLKVPDGI
jgi:hypothetical protein